MRKRAYENMKKLRTLLDVDPEYGELERRRREAETEFLTVLEEMTWKQRETILHYFGIMQEQGLREIELACCLNGE